MRIVQHALQRRQEALRRFRESVLPRLESHEKLLADAASGGQLDVVAVLTAEDVLLRSRREYVGLRLAHHLAWLALDRAVGPHSRGAGNPEPREGVSR